MKHGKLTGVICLVAATFLSAYTVIKNPADDTCVKSIVCDGVTTTKFIYNGAGKISEIESLFGYDRFTYDQNNHLVKHEHAMGPNATSSSYNPNQKKEMFTAKNATITLREMYEFDARNNLKKIKLYVNADSRFEFRNIKEFIYENNRIVRSNRCDTNGILTGYTTYDYDKNRNMINEKEYYYATQYLVPKLLCEYAYEFDNKHNIYQIYSHMGEPGYRTNPNNIIRSLYTLHDTRPEDKKLYPQVSKMSYAYNEKGFPVIENERWEYKY